MGSTDLHILELVRLMRAELQAGAPNGSLCGESPGHDLAVHLHQHDAALPRERARGGLGPQRRRRVVEFLHENATFRK